MPTPVIVTLVVVALGAIIALTTASISVARSMSRTTGTITELAERLHTLEERTGQLRERLREIDTDLADVADALDHDAPRENPSPAGGRAPTTSRGGHADRA